MKETRESEGSLVGMKETRESEGSLVGMKETRERKLSRVIIVMGIVVMASCRRSGRLAGPQCVCR
jgi:hypothetical protein